MLGQPDYNNNKVRVSLHDIIREPPEPTAPAIRRKAPTEERQYLFQKMAEETRKADQLRKEHFRAKYSRKKQRSPPVKAVVFSPQREKIGLLSKEVTVEQIMDKVSRIKEEIVLKKRAISLQKLSKAVSRPVGVVDCCAQALDSSAGFGKFNAMKQMEHRPREQTNKSKSMIRPLTRQNSASARVIENPRNAMDRAVNFLIKEIDPKGDSEEKTEVAYKLYKNLKGGDPDVETRHKIKTILTAKKSPLKNQRVSQQPEEKVVCNGSSIVVTKFQPLGNGRKNSPARQSPDPLHQHKYEIPFNEQTERKQRFLKKGSNITGMILQHIFKGEHLQEVDQINFEKEKFLEEYNQTLPEELSKRWKEDIQRSLKILKGKFNRKQESTKPDRYGGFDVEDVIYLSDNKRLYFDRNLNDYYEDGSDMATSPHVP